MWNPKYFQTITTRIARNAGLRARQQMRRLGAELAVNGGEESVISVIDEAEHQPRCDLGENVWQEEYHPEGDGAAEALRQDQCQG